jgi:DNA invertase Pin-like site-specific DNA recombinase
MKYGYARGSTMEQDLQDQIDALKNEGCALIYQEKFTGTTGERPQLGKVLNVLKSGDTLVVTKLDRLARNTKEGIEIIEVLFAHGVSVHVLNVGLLEKISIGRFFLQTLLAVAEMERNIIIERTQEGKQIAKQRPDFREGRPRKHSSSQVNHALSLLSDHSYTNVERMTGISKATLVRRMRERKAQESELE